MKSFIHPILLLLTAITLGAQSLPPLTPATENADEYIILSCAFIIDPIDEDEQDAQLLADIEAALDVLTPGFLQRHENDNDSDDLAGSELDDCDNEGNEFVELTPLTVEAPAAPPTTPITPTATP